MKTYLLTWKTDDDQKICNLLGGTKQVTVIEDNAEDAILKGSFILMELLAKEGKVLCDCTPEDDGICIRVYDQKLKGRKLAELRNIRAKEIWEV